MSATIIVTEGEGDRRLLEALLSHERHTRIVAAGGRSAAISLARSFLVNGQNNVALVVDAETSDPGLVESGKRFLKRSLADVATRSQWQVSVLVPEIEILLFDNRAVLEAFVGRDVADTDIVEGQFAPKRTLSRLLQDKGLLQAYQEVLPHLDLTPLRARPEMRQLQEFLNSLAQQVAA